MLDLNHVRQSLAQHKPNLRPFVRDSKNAAVALILSGDPQDLTACFIHRAERLGDPWSGHMALPGGRAGLSDASAREVAERETLEEIGISLNGSELIGSLSDLPITFRTRDTGMVLSSLVYYLEGEPPGFQLNEEVADAHWVPASHLWNPANVTSMKLFDGPEELVFPAIRFNDQVIWGLTYRVLTMFAAVLDQPLPGLQSIQL